MTKKVKDPRKSPPSAAELIALHSQARVVKASEKQFVRMATTPYGHKVPVGSRKITDVDAVDQVLRQFAK